MKGRVQRVLVKALETKLGSVIDALYPTFSVVALFMTYVGASRAIGTPLYFDAKVLRALVMVFLAYSLISLLDDYYDYKNDVQIAKYRPLPSKRLTFLDFRFLYMLFFHWRLSCNPYH